MRRELRQDAQPRRELRISASLRRPVSHSSDPIIHRREERSPGASTHTVSSQVFFFKSLSPRPLHPYFVRVRVSDLTGILKQAQVTDGGKSAGKRVASAWILCRGCAASSAVTSIYDDLNPQLVKAHRTPPPPPLFLGG